MSLAKKWKAPNPNRQVGQISFRPALHILAKLNALTTVFDRNKTEIINDLLEKALPYIEEELRDIEGHNMEEHMDEEIGPYESKKYRNLDLFHTYEDEFKKQLEKLKGDSTEKN